MKKYSDKPINRLRTKKNNIVYIFIVSILLALAVNLLVYGLSELLPIANYIYIIASVSIMLICLIVYIVIETKRNNRLLTFKGFFVFDEKNKKLLRVPLYEISSDMSRFLQSAFVENKAILNIWQNGICNKNNNDETNFKAMSDLLIELIEYCILDKMSTYVTDHFNKINNKKYKIVEYGRNELAEILLSNRFIKLFTEPMENREAFININKNLNRICRVVNDNNRETILAYSSSGAEYRSLFFELPQGTKINRTDKGALKINMRSFEIKIRINFEGYCTFIPTSFHEFFLNKPSDNLTDFNFDVQIQVKNKLKSIISPIKWIEYDWIDGFIDKLENYLDKERYFSEIDWKKLEANLIINQTMINKFSATKK